MKTTLLMLVLLGFFNHGFLLECYSCVDGSCHNIVDCDGSCKEITIFTKGKEKSRSDCSGVVEDKKCEKLEVHGTTTMTCFCNEDKCNSGTFPSLATSVLILVPLTLSLLF